MAEDVSFARLASAGVPPALDAAAVIDVTTVHGPLFLHRDDAVMTPEIRNTGRWEPEEERFILSALRPGATFLDVGANVGYFSVAGARAVTEAGRVVAVEPEPRNVALLRANLWRKGLRNQPRRPPGPRPRHVRHRRARARRPARRGPRGLQPDLVKIDTQGADHHVVDGLRGLLHPGITLLCEFWLDGMAGHGAEEAIRAAGWEGRFVNLVLRP